MHSPSIRPVPLSKLRVGKNVRPGPLDVSDLVESFDKGVPQLQNVVVRVLDGGDYELVAGHRRVQAAQEMGWTHLDAKILDVDDVTAECFALEENLRRKKLPNEAAAIARLVELHEAQAPARRGGDRRSIRFLGPNRQVAALKTPVLRVAKIIGQSERDVRRKVLIGKRGSGGTTWTFTHSWRQVPRSAWGDAISILASVEKSEEIEEARRQGYAAAIVVPEFPDEKAFKIPGTTVTAIPCPAEVCGTTCAECRLCLDQDLFGTGRAIAFAAHGQTANLVREHLVQLRARRGRTDR